MPSASSACGLAFSIIIYVCVKSSMYVQTHEPLKKKAKVSKQKIFFSPSLPSRGLGEVRAPSDNRSA